MKDTDKFGPKTIDAAKRLAKEDTARVTKEVTPIVENQLKKEAADIKKNGSMPTDIAGVETATPNISTTTNNDNDETTNETNNQSTTNAPSSSQTTNITNEVHNHHYVNPNSPEGRLLADDTINPNGSMKDTDKFGPKTLDAAKRLAKEDTARVTKELLEKEVIKSDPRGRAKFITDKVAPTAAPTAAPVVTAPTAGTAGTSANTPKATEPVINTPLSLEPDNVIPTTSTTPVVPIDIGGVESTNSNISATTNVNEINSESTIEPNNQSTTNIFPGSPASIISQLAFSSVSSSEGVPNNNTTNSNITPTSSPTTLNTNVGGNTINVGGNTTNTNTSNQNVVIDDKSLSMYTQSAQYSDPSETYKNLSKVDYTNIDEYTKNNTQVDPTTFIDSYTQGNATDFNVNLDSNSSNTTIEGVSNDANANSISRPYNDTILDDGNSNSEPNAPSSSPVSSVSSQQNNNTTINTGNQNISNTSSNITNGNVTINQSTTQQNTTNNTTGTTNSTSTSGTMLNGFNQNNNVDSNSNSNQTFANVRHNTTINAMLGGQSTTHALLSSYNDTIGIDDSESNQTDISNNSTDAFTDNSQSNQTSVNNNQSASSNISNPSYTNNNFNSNKTSYTGDTNNTTNRFSNSVEFDGINKLFKSDYSTKISNISRSSTLTDTSENIKQIIREIISEESEKTKENEESLYQDMNTSTPQDVDVQFMDNQSAATDNINTNLVNDYSSLMDIMQKISSPPIWRTAIG